MDTKQLVTVIVIFALGMTAVLVIAMAMYKFTPELLGIKSKETKVVFLKEDSIPRESMIQISESRYKEINDEVGKKLKLKKEKDSLLLASQKLLDSINGVKKELARYQDSVKNVNAKVNLNNDKFKALQDSILKISGEYRKTQDKLKIAEQKIQSQEEFIEEDQDSISIDSYKEFAKIYNNTNPAEVAKILEAIDERDAAQILKFMNKKKAGKVIESLKAEKAAAILLLGNI